LNRQSLKIVEFEGDKYFCNNIDAFIAAPPEQRYGQRILRVIDRIIFYSRGALDVYAFTDAEKKTLTDIQEPDTDPLLIEIVKMAHGADHSDIEKLRDCKRIIEFRELTELGSSIPAGLGFPGKGFGILKAEFGFPLFEKRIFLQIVHSYMEGYSIEHQELTNELY